MRAAITGGGSLSPTWCVLLLVLVAVLALCLALGVIMMRSCGKPASAPVQGGAPAPPPSVASCHVQEPWFSLIAKRRKTVEGKASSLERWKGAVGSPVQFQNGDRQILAVVTAVRHYPDLSSFLDREWLAAAPQARSREHAEELYMSVTMKPRGPNTEKFSTDAGGNIQVFGKKRVAERGGMSAVEFAIVPKDLFTWLGEKLSKNPSEARKVLAQMKTFLVKRMKLTAEAEESLVRHLETWARSKRPDGEVMAAIRTVAQAYPRPKPAAKEKGRMVSRVRDIEDHLFAMLMQDSVPKLQRYLDVGCAEGSLTDAIGGALELRGKDSIHGCDIFPVPPAALQDLDFTYKQAVSHDLPYPADHFQVVSCIMSLHHFVYLERSLSEIYRVLEPGGILLFREHDCPDESFARFLDFVHYAYAVSLGTEITLTPGQEAESFNAQRDVLFSYYRTKGSWIETLRKAGFRLVEIIEPKMGGPPGQQGKKKNRKSSGGHKRTDAFRSFYGLFQKPP